jgi:hypothetical protein
VLEALRDCRGGDEWEKADINQIGFRDMVSFELSIERRRDGILPVGTGSRKIIPVRRNSKYKGTEG